MAKIDKNLALKVILMLAIAGMAFSGYLSYGELTRGTCPIGGGCSQLAGIPTCVYGFIMYTLVLIVSILGLKAKK
jgi:uncharacterized membrane protein